MNPPNDPLLAFVVRLARDAADRAAGARERRAWATAAARLGVELQSTRSRRGLQLSGTLLGHEFHARNAPSTRSRTPEQIERGDRIPLDRVRLTVDFRGPEGLELRTSRRGSTTRKRRSRFDLPAPGGAPPPEYLGYLTPKRLAALHDLADLVREIDARRIHAELVPAPATAQPLVDAATRLVALARTLELRPGDPPAL